MRKSCCWVCATFWGSDFGAAASSLAAFPAAAAGGGAAGAKLKSLDSRSKAVLSSIVCDTKVWTSASCVQCPLSRLSECVSTSLGGLAFFFSSSIFFKSQI